jgi:hypothetical protein
VVHDLKQQLGFRVDLGARATPSWVMNIEIANQDMLCGSGGAQPL